MISEKTPVCTLTLTLIICAPKQVWYLTYRNLRKFFVINLLLRRVFLWERFLTLDKPAYFLTIITAAYTVSESLHIVQH